MNRECNVTKRAQTDKGLRYRPVVLSANGRIKPHMVHVNGVPDHHPEGSYYLEWYEGSKRKRLSVGKDAQDAHARRLLHKRQVILRSGHSACGARLPVPKSLQRS